MRTHLAAVALAAAAGVVLGNAPEQPVIGIYHWDGAAAKSISAGVERIAELGGRAARIAVSARYYTDYNAGSECYRDFSLPAIVREPDLRRALGNERIEIFMLTAYDGTSFGDCTTKRFLNPEFYTAENTASMVKEYSDLTLYLYETYKNTGKQFILSNWEGDNTIYCGGAYAYATDPAFRAECDRRYSELYSGNDGPEKSLTGFRLWFETRELGIADGRQRARALGFGGIEVYQAPEFSIVRTLRDAGLKSVLYDVLPYLGFERVSYSSYESIDRTDPAAALEADLETIRGVSGATRIIIGEMGFARSVWKEDAIGRIQAIVSTAAAAGVPLIFQWQLYDQAPGIDYGLYDSEDKLTEIGVFFRQVLSGAAEERVRAARPGAGRR